MLLVPPHQTVPQRAVYMPLACLPCSALCLQVEDDEVALRLTAELNRGKCGRVSFMPLNRLKPPVVQYPDQVLLLPALRCAVA